MLIVISISNPTFGLRPMSTDSPQQGFITNTFLFITHWVANCQYMIVDWSFVYSFEWCDRSMSLHVLFPRQLFIVVKGFMEFDFLVYPNMTQKTSGINYSFHDLLAPTILFWCLKKFSYMQVLWASCSVHHLDWWIDFWSQFHGTRHGGFRSLSTKGMMWWLLMTMLICSFHS